jgi:hypothetical protein
MSPEDIAVLEEKMRDNPFVKLQENFSSYYKISKETENSPHYIAPIQFKLPRNAAGKECPFQYVPIIETVTAIISDPDFDSLSQEPAPDGYLHDFKDGSAWKKNQFFIDNPDALTGQLYSDAVELDNPLGASKGVHKALNVYFSLVDIPKSLRSKTDNIFLVLTALEKDLKEKKEENYACFFKPLVEDLKKLESGVQIGGKTIKMGLICYSADNLEASVIGGFSQCFSSNDVCRICHKQHKDLQDISGIPKDVGGPERSTMQLWQTSCLESVVTLDSILAACSMFCRHFIVLVASPLMSCTISVRKWQPSMPCQL